MASFNGQVALVTGAGRGLGLAYARCLGILGATVLIQDVGADAEGRGADPDIAERAAATLRSERLDARALAGALDTRDACRALVSDALAHRDRLDALIHNAG